MESDDDSNLSLEDGQLDDRAIRLEVHHTAENGATGPAKARRLNILPSDAHARAHDGGGAKASGGRTHTIADLDMGAGGGGGGVEAVDGDDLFDLDPISQHLEEEEHAQLQDIATKRQLKDQLKAKLSRELGHFSDEMLDGGKRSHGGRNSGESMYYSPVGDGEIHTSHGKMSQNKPAHYGPEGEIFERRHNAAAEKRERENLLGSKAQLSSLADQDKYWNRSDNSGKAVGRGRRDSEILRDGARERGRADKARSMAQYDALNPDQMYTAYAERLSALDEEVHGGPVYDADGHLLAASTSSPMDAHWSAGPGYGHDESRRGIDSDHYNDLKAQASRDGYYHGPATGGAMASSKAKDIEALHADNILKDLFLYRDVTERGRWVRGRSLVDDLQLQKNEWALKNNQSSFYNISKADATKNGLFEPADVESEPKPTKGKGKGRKKDHDAEYNPTKGGVIEEGFEKQVHLTRLLTPNNHLDDPANQRFGKLDYHECDMSKSESMAAKNADDENLPLAGMLRESWDLRKEWFDYQARVLTKRRRQHELLAAAKRSKMQIEDDGTPAGDAHFRENLRYRTNMANEGKADLRDWGGEADPNKL